MKEKPLSPALSPREVLAEINLSRAWWILIVSTICTLLFTLSGRLTGTSEAFSSVQLMDYIGSSISIALFCLVRWGPSPAWLKRKLPLGYALFFVLINDGYYFSAWQVTGDNVGYAFGVLTPAALIYLRPAIFAPFLVVNHLAVCVGILLEPAKFESTVSAIYGTSIVVVIALITSVIQYRSKVAELEKTALIARRNAELAASNSSLLAMSQRMDEVMATAAHDLRAPLQAMAGLCELELEKPPRGGADQRRVFEVIAEGSGRLVALVNRMLAEYAARHDSIEGLVLTECDLADSLRDAANQARPLGLRKDIEIRGAQWVGPALVEANAEALERVLGNLISNAIKYSPEETRVELEIARSGHFWICEVRDEGPGIPVGERDSLFQKLQRGSNLPTSGEESTGLGLYIARKLVEAMHGTIEFQPGPTGGATFRISLPATPQGNADLVVNRVYSRG
ncbi:hypothetical protein BH09VER1_BH09VER1_41380 [soil metagenome]